MKHEASLPSSQEPVTGPYPELVQSSPRPVSSDPHFQKQVSARQLEPEVHSLVSSPYGQNSVTRASLAPREGEVANDVSYCASVIEQRPSGETNFCLAPNSHLQKDILFAYTKRSAPFSTAR
jgi:hypothetical protein